MTDPAPPRMVPLPADSGWRGARCWECDEPVTDDEAIVWDGRIWHVAHWRGDLVEPRQVRQGRGDHGPLHVVGRHLRDHKM